LFPGEKTQAWVTVRAFGSRFWVKPEWYLGDGSARQFTLNGIPPRGSHSRRADWQNSNHGSFEEIV
jgi:hypothetical protein